MTQTAKERHTSLKTKLKELRDERKKVLEEMGNCAKELFQDESKTLFEKYAALESFAWTQYTPHWNDGSPCRFSVHTDYPDINGENVDDLAEKLPNGDYGIPDDSPDKWKEAASEEVVKFLGQFTKDDYEQMFGDHVKVTVSAKGGKIKVTAEEYDHD
jgi:hypothetical protein